MIGCSFSSFAMDNNPNNPANYHVRLKSGAYVNLLTVGFIAFKVRDLYLSNDQKDRQAFKLLLKSAAANKPLETTDEEIQRRLLFLNPSNHNVQHVVWSMSVFHPDGKFIGIRSPLAHQ